MTSMAYSETKQYPIISCNLCGSQQNFQCKVVKAMLVKRAQAPGPH